MNHRASNILLTGLALAIVWWLVPTQAAAQGCNPVSQGRSALPIYECSYPVQNYTGPITAQSPFIDEFGQTLPMTVVAGGTITVGAGVGTGIPLSLLSVGSENSPAGGYAGTLTITNDAGLIVTPGSSSGNLYGLLAQQTGGDGQFVSGTAGTPGGNTYPLSVTNTGAITIGGGGTVNVNGSGAALYASATGGVGSEGDLYTNPNGGSGGSANGPVTIANSGTINVTASGTNGFGGIEALSQGGNAGIIGAVGGYSGASSVTNSAPVTVAWTWQGTYTANTGVYGIVASSISGSGASGERGNSGGHGGDATSASVTLSQGANVSVTALGTPPSYSTINTFYGAGLAAIVQAGSGAGGQTNGASVRGGEAGTGPTATQITVTDASVMVSGANMPALLSLALGGAGGDATVFPNPSYAGGDGGNAANGDVAVSATAGLVTLSTSGNGAPAIMTLLQGGAGGPGGYYDPAFGGSGGNGGDGGNAGTASATVKGRYTTGVYVALSTTGNYSPGMYLGSIGGAGNVGGGVSATLRGSGGNGGNGGNSAGVSISIGDTAISTQGNNAPGIIAQAQGGQGGTGGTVYDATVSLGAAGGSGGSTGPISVTVDIASAITTLGQNSSGIIAQSASGAGGDAGGSSGIFSAGAGGGDGGSVGTITISNAATITTSGAASRGILAQAISGGGGGGGNSFGILFGSAGSGGSTGSIGAITISNVGSITTSGANAQGILAQSIAGGGGAGGQSSSVVDAVGGDGSTNPIDADAGAVIINGLHGSIISTRGLSSIGILGQSIGGGGGDGGSATGGLAVSVGGSGGGGGSGGAVQATLTSSSVSTRGDGAHGAVMQSIGGGGGNAGNVVGGIGLFTSVGIGGIGGGGGQGGTAAIDLSDTNIFTEGSKAAGLVVQSIGGGGGTGGTVSTNSVGVGISASVAVGGSGGSGGSGSQASAQLVGGSIATGQDPALLGTSGSAVCPALPCNLLPVDTYGAVIQSIGGGGGMGGSAIARALAIAFPVPMTDGTQVGLSASAALGGSGGSGGDGGTVIFFVSQGGKITTSGQGGTGVLLQSIGGGGGAGGDSSAMSAVLGYGSATVPAGASAMSGEANFSLGAKGGSGGNGGSISFALGGTVDSTGSTFYGDSPSAPGSIITTAGDFAAGIKAQSIGGGGGDAGYGSGTTQSFGTGYNATVGITLGAHGGAGGNGGTVKLLVFPISAASTSTIQTWGSGAVGVLGQSVGGGGGTSSGGSFNFGGTAGSDSDGSVVGQVNLALGMQGAAGGTGGEVIVAAQAPITTHGGDSAAVFAQSVGGGGGVGGSAGSDASADNPIVAGLYIREGANNILKDQVAAWVGTFSQSIGGQGGIGNTGGAVTVTLSPGSALTTSGDWSSGVIAQSIGGGGGKGGTSAATGTGGRPDITINANMAIGGSGGTGGDGGLVTVNLAGTAIATAGFGAIAVVGQSIGSGGGMAADGSDVAWGAVSLGGTISGSGGTGGNGGNVVLNTSAANFIATTGQAATAVVLQSVGGGGGMGGWGSSFQYSEAHQSLGHTIKEQAGAAPNVGGSGGSVAYVDAGTTTITTSGNNAFGIVGQSVGGGGGIVIQSEIQSRLATTSGNTLETSILGGGSSSSYASGGPVSVTLNSGSSIATTGSGAHGIIAQSVGGGGGIVGMPGDMPSLTTVVPSGTSFAGTGYGDGGPVTVTNGGNISVTGYGAIGILAQSIGGSGGIVLA